MTYSKYLSKAVRIFLRLFFKFDWWHTSPLENRKYASDIIAEVNNYEHKGVVVEVGCGLGDIIGNLKFQRKFFFDVSENALNAARFMQRFRRVDSDNQFKVFNLFEDVINESIKCDVIIIVNWIHAFESAILAPAFHRIVEKNMKSGSTLVFDLLPPEAGHLHHHQISDLINDESFQIKIFDGYRFGRRIVFATLR